MNWISANWEKILLLLVSLLAIVLGAMFVKNTLSFRDRFQFAEMSKSRELPVVDIGEVRRAQEAMALVEPWKTPVRGAPASKEVPLFVSVPIVQVGDKVIDMTDPNAPLIRPPVSNNWLRDNGLDYKLSNILELDADGDKFTNLEEWDAKTDPTDDEAHPPYGTKLVMIERKQQNYVIEFASTPDANSFQLTRHQSSNYKRKTFILPMGGITDDGKLKLESYENILEPRGGINVDVSKLTVTYVETGEKFELVRRQRLTIPTYFLEVSYPFGELERAYFRKGEEIVLPNDPETKYKVIDIEENLAKIGFLDANGTENIFEIEKQN